MNSLQSILLVTLIALVCQRGSGFRKHYIKNDIDVTSYPSVGNKFQRPVIDGLPLRNMENAIFKARANNLKDVFRHSVDTIKMKSKKVDIIFLIDSSSSIGKVNFHSEINFVKKLLSHFDLSFNYTRIALITFSSHSKVIRHIDQISSPNEDHDQCSAVTNDIPGIEFVGGGTFTYGALKEAQKIFSTARPKSRKYIFLVTDGFSNGKDPIPIAEDLKANNVTIFTIGIQSGNYGELYNISSYPKETHNFLLDSFKEFEKLARGALMQDHKLGYSIKLSNPDRCSVLCEEDFDLAQNGNETTPCCNALATCECRIPSGHYSCTCPDGYVGEGLGEDCLPCMRNTYWHNSAMCLPCPDINHVTLVSPALSIKDCICKPGFKRTIDDRCEGITCPKLNPPENGYFVTQPATCANVLNAACGARCKSGYQLTGSSLRLCQENGTWSGTEAQCVLKTCPSLPVPLNGMITCQNHDLELSSYDYSPHNDTFMTHYRDEKKRRTEPMPIDTECSYRCGPGNYLVGSRNRNCLPLSKWDGRQTTCKTVLCAPLPKPKFGSYKLPECTKTKQPYGTNCTLICPEGFTLKGVETRTCSGKKNGLWTPKNKNSKCIDITPPKLVCPVNYTLELPADSDSIVLHSLPLPLEAQDSSTSTVTIWTKPSVDDTAGVRLKIGHHTFTYFASDIFSNKAECNFRVTVIDRTPPRVENCIDPGEFWISKDETPSIEWEEPIFVDNSNEAVTVKMLTALDPRKALQLVAGEYPVLYTGQDRSKNYNECLLNITVKELNCDPLSAPQHGLSYCARNISHTWCEVTCDYGYAISDEESGEYLDNFRLTCDHKHPGWKYKILPDCTKLDLPESVGQSFTITLDSENPLCSSSDSQNTFVSSLSDQMKTYLCSDLTDCDVISEIPECIQENDVHDDPPLGDREKYHISKREIPSNQNQPKKSRKRIRSNVKIRLYTKISKRLGLWQKNVSLSENIRQMKYEVQRLDTNEPLKRVLQDMQIDVKRLKIEEFVRCPDGSVSKKNICFQCARGTYQDAAFNRCKLCPLGTFNPDYGQVRCFDCPPHHSTRREGRLNGTDCKAQCPPGSWAKMRPGQRRTRPGLTTPHSLMPFCRKCSAGEYQPAYDQTSCLLCPEGLTSARGSTSLYDCREQRASHVCEYQPRICGHFGQCVPESGAQNLYSCICPEGYLGAHCEHKIDLCLSAPCYNNGVCSYINGTTVACHCPPEFVGNYCEELRNSCDVTVCKNGGTCIDLEDVGPVCECQTGYEGKHCEETVNYCDSMPCESGICHNQSNGYSCQCPPGVIGRRCHLRPCDNLPCHRNAICVDLMQFPATRGSYECKCPTGLRGSDCTQIVDPCDEQPCKNNGICKPVALRQVGVSAADELRDDADFLKFTCTCPPYFYGELCEIFTKPDFVMKFHKASTLNYVEMKGPDRDLSELSFCTWIKTSDIFTYGSVLSYATKDHDNAFTLTDYSGFVLYVNGNSSGSDIVANDGEWHFVCVSWTSDNGYYEIYFDGRLEHAGMNLSAGEQISANGIFIIGQEQDKLGGGFSEQESFIGQIAYLDVWDSFLSGEQIHNFYTSCDPYRGTLYSWTDFKANIRGDIDILPSTFCQECPKDLHIPNGVVRYMANRAFYQCNPGYNLRGLTPVRHCLRTSKWSVGAPYCEMVNCGDLSPVENGNIEYSSGTTLHSVAEYICNNGYVVDGNEKRICLTMGVWSGTEPVCRSSVQCERLVLLDNMKVLYANDKGLIPIDQEVYPVGVYAEITCLLTMNDYFLTCMDDGGWDGSLPDCVPLQQAVIPTTQLPPITATITSTTETTTSTSTTELARRLSFEWAIPVTWPIDEVDVRSTPLVVATTMVVPTEDQRPSSGELQAPELQTTSPSEESSEFMTTIMDKDRIPLTSSQEPIQAEPKHSHSFPYPDKDFWSLLYEFLYKGCLDENSNKIILCTLKEKPVPYTNLFAYDQNNFDKFTDIDVQLLELLEKHSADILEQPSGIPFEYFLDMILYGKDFPDAQRVDADLEDALRFTLCIFIDAIAWESKFNQMQNVEEDSTAMENRSSKLKKLIRQLIGPVYADYRTRFSSQLSPTDSSILMRTRKSTGKDYSEEIVLEDDDEWLIGGDIEEPSGCDWGGLPEPPADGIIKQFWESETVEFGTEVEYGCGFHYEPTGETWISKCLSNSQWSEVDYTCQMAWCGSPPTLPNMSVEWPSDRYRIGDVVNLVCNQGFLLSRGTSQIECLANGTWSRMLTWCTRVSCNRPVLPPDAEIVKGNFYLYEDSVTIKCPNQEAIEITCNEEAKWTPNPQDIC